MSDMKRFNALKKVTAKPMTRGEYNDLRGWNVSTSAKDEEGYLIVDPEIEANTLSYHGEVSWVSKENFERYYYEPDNERVGEMCTAPQDTDHVLTGDEIKRFAEAGSLCYRADLPRNIFQQEFIPNERDDSDIKFDFGIAIRKLKEGKRVMRDGWNGKGMFLYYVPAASYPMQRNSLKTMGGIFPDDMVPYGAYIAMKTAQDNVVPWLASQTDVLAEDWQLA